MQAVTEADVPEPDPEVMALEALTRVLVGIAWECAHAAPPGVTFPQTRLLLILERMGRVPSSRLAAAMGVNASSVTRLANKLEALGYLARGRDEHNRSVVTVEVTEAGQALVNSLMAQRYTALSSVLARMSGPQRQAAAASARRIVGAAVTLPGLGTAGPGPL